MRQARDEGWGDWIRNAQDEEAIQQGCYFNERKGRFVCDAIEQTCRLSHGEFAGEQIQLLDWQSDKLIMPLFGWMKPDGFRRFRVAFITVPKKNGKSTLFACLGIVLLVFDGEAGAEVYTAAADRDQAKIVFGEAARMVRKSPELDRELVIRNNVHTIAFPATESKLEALSADAYTKEGRNISGAVIDELHIHKTPDLYETLRYGGAARRQPLLASITTAGTLAGGGRFRIGYREYQYAKQVLAGKIVDTSYFALIYEADAKDDPHDEATWFKANPSLGHAMTLDGFREDYQRAKNGTRQEFANWLRYRLNLWLDAEDIWLDMEAWAACNAPQKPPEGRVCYGALDIGAVNDLSAFAIACPEYEETEDGRRGKLLGVDLWVWLWCPEANIEKLERETGAPYREWINKGWLKTTPGEVQDQDFIRRDINEICKDFHVAELAVDRLFNGSQMCVNLSNDGFLVVDHGQGYLGMATPTKEFEKLVLAKLLRHGGNEALEWQASNALTKPDPAGNIKPDKEKSPFKIDGIVASIMAVGRATAGVVEESVYEHRGVQAF